MRDNKHRKMAGANALGRAQAPRFTKEVGYWMGKAVRVRLLVSSLTFPVGERLEVYSRYWCMPLSTGLFITPLSYLEQIRVFQCSISQFISSNCGKLSDFAKQV